jgi:G:T/U-mismatch repair DNA glycosylase
VTLSRETIEASQDRLTREVEALPFKKLQQEETKARLQFTSDLKKGTWKSNFRGRDILRRFVGQHCSQMRYEIFRNLVLVKMRDDGYTPAGMKQVIDTILEA